MTDEGMEKENEGGRTQTHDNIYLQLNFSCSYILSILGDGMSLVHSVRLSGKMMKSRSVPSLLSQCMMQNIQKYSKVMQIFDTATSDYGA